MTNDGELEHREEEKSEEQITMDLGALGHRKEMRR